MSKLILTCLLLYLTLLMEVAVAREIVWVGMRPSFLAVALVGWVMREQGNRRLLLAAFIGLLGDCFSGGQLGIGMMLCVVSVWIIEMLNSKSRKKSNSFFQLALVMSFYVMGNNTVLMILAGKTESGPQVLWQSCGTILYSGLLAAGLSVLRLVVSKLWSHSSLRYAR